MNYIKLTPRLQCVADMVKNCDIVADIGTDHAYIPIYLVQSGAAKAALASDVVEGPVKIAGANVDDYCLGDKIKVVKAYGLKAVKGADTAVIAGMGGKLICDILNEDMDIARSFENMILQPMTCQYELRKFLHAKGFAIVEEKLAKEDDKIYNIMSVCKGKQIFKDDFYYHTGKYVFEHKDNLLGEYLHKKAEVIKKRITGMKKSKKRDIYEEMKNLEGLYNRLKEEEANYDKGC